MKDKAGDGEFSYITMQSVINYGQQPCCNQQSPEGAPKGYNPNFLLITGDWFGFTFLFSELE